MTRRRFFLKGAAGLGAIGAGCMSVSARALQTYEVTKTDAEWRKILSPAQYAVLRQGDTEAPGSSPLLKEKRRGTYACAGCGLDLFSSATKFDAGTGWPSFWAPLDKAIATRRETTLGIAHTEVHCRRCGGHLGDVFDDGPKPTGLRYCI